MSIKGNLSSIPLADIMQLVGMGEKVGCLKITGSDDIGYIYFVKGNIVYAYSENNKVTIEKINQHQKILDATKLNSIIKVSQEKKLNPLEIMVKGNIVKKDDIENIVKNYILGITYGFFKLGKGDFEFLENEQPKNPLLLIEEHYGNVIMEGSRRIDEIELVKKTIPSDKTRFIVFITALDKLDSIKLREDEKKILALVSKMTNIYEISRHVELEEFDLMKYVFGFVQSKILEVIPQESYEIIQEHVDLARFYLERANEDEALREAIRAFSLAPTDENNIMLLKLCLKNGTLPEEVKRHFVHPYKFAPYTKYGPETLKFIKEQQPTLKSEMPKPSYAGKPAPATAAPAAPKINPKEALINAAKYLRDGQYQDAVNILVQTGEIRISNYYLILGNSYIKLNKIREAHDCFSKLLVLEPENEKVKKLVETLKTKI